MAQRNLRTSVDTRENVLSFARLNTSASGTNALNLVYQAAEVFASIENHARETEARAQSLCKSALEKLKSAEVRIEAVERARREVIVEAEGKLQHASRVAQTRMKAIEDKLTATEFRAQAAEAEAREAKQSLALVEEAIRRRLLCATPEAVGAFV
ncbi:hypothetical protein [Bradyrhizobium sp. AUGA SZCCT0182]|uniref:hypothetical protein n=1 Tax=Bradyrhizobium sp. AUGA SZCCT0182 TaxID=2807667 RepID=UPI002011245B|nr:hypothetical protein [Bradyrhizobium sp. AUGA SZCCT0182]